VLTASPRNVIDPLNFMDCVVFTTTEIEDFS